MAKKPKLNLKPLQMLDLAKCKSVSDIVDGMSRCAFGARMLGEVAATLTKWYGDDQHKPVIIYDGKPDTPLGKLLNRFSDFGRFNCGVTTPEYAGTFRHRNAVVVGAFSERHEDILFTREPGTTIYINQFDMAAPGQVKDGFFPNTVFADPRFIMPIIEATLDERLNGRRCTVDNLFSRLARYGGVANQMMGGADTITAMMKKKDTRRFLTLSGAMTIAQMSLVVCEMIERGMIHSITSTGALMAHGLVPGLGLSHYKYDPKDDDKKLAGLGLNRVTDVLEPETNFDHIDEIMGAVLATFSGSTAISPSILHEALGKYLVKKYPYQRAILNAAYRHKVPVFVPAFTDSELGNDVFCTNELRRLQRKKRIVMDMEKDTMRLMDLMTSAKHAGIWTYGGGVPRNWTQNVSPLIEIYNNRMEEHGHKLFPMKKFRFGCRCCPDRPHFGHLSGCTYQEGKSWRKFHFNGMFAEIQADATQVEPFLVKYIMDQQDAGLLH